MVNNRNDVDLQFNFDINNADVRKTRQAVRGATTELEKFGKQDAKLAQSAARTAKAISGQVLPVDKLAKATNKAAKGQKNLATETKKSSSAMQKQTKIVSSLDARLDRLDTDFSNISRGVGQAGDIESNIRALSGAGGTIPGLEGISTAGGAGAELFAVIEAAPRLKVAFQGFPSILEKSAEALGTNKIGLIGGIGGIAIAAGAAAFVIDRLNKRYEETKEQVQAAIDKEVEYRALIREGSQESLEAAQKQLESERATAQDRIDIAQENRTALVAEAAETDNTTLEIARSQLDNTINALLPISSSLTQEYATQGDIIAENAQKVLDLNVSILNHVMALGSQDVATREAAAAEEELAAQRQQARVNEINDTATLERILLQAQDQTSAQIQARLDTLAEEEGVLRRLIERMKEAGEDTAELERQLSLNVRTAILLREAALGVAKARETEIAFIEGQSASLARFNATQKEAQADAAKRVEQLAAINQKIEDANAAHAQKLIDISANLSKAISDADVKKSAALGKAEADASESRTEARIKALADLEKLQEQHQANIAKINRRSNASLANAIGNRDALAFKAAQEAQQTALKEENDSFNDRRKAIDTQLKETNRQIEKRLIEQRRTAERQYDEIVKRAQDAADKQVRLENDKHNALITAQREAANKIIADAQSAALLALAINKAGADGTLDIHESFWDSALRQAQAALDELNATDSKSDKSKVTFIGGGTTSGGSKFGGKSGGASTPSFGSKALSVTIPAFQSGGIVERTGLAFVDKGEFFRTPAQEANLQRQLRGNGGGGVTVNIGRISGANRKQITEQIFFEIENALDEANIN